MKDKAEKSPVDGNAVRVMFSFEDDDVSKVDELRHRLGREISFVNKREVVRLGLLALAELPDKRVIKLADELRRMRAGRRPKESSDD